MPTNSMNKRSDINNDRCGEDQLIKEIGNIKNTITVVEEKIITVVILTVTIGSRSRDRKGVVTNCCKFQLKIHLRNGIMQLYEFQGSMYLLWEIYFFCDQCKDLQRNSLLVICRQLFLLYQMIGVAWFKSIPNFSSIGSFFSNYAWNMLNYMVCGFSGFPWRWK